ncbi:MAG: HlyD family efflux transporter periplasmic adaptor subunit [Firmicutes bacterium]|nr:HlyD family efflux transporter periplasmic adaptor subunit [Bacillota bacterium]
MILLVTIVGGVIIWYRWEHRTKYVDAVPQNLVRMVQADALCYRLETTFYAPADGKIEQLVKDDTRVPANTVIAMVGSYPIYAETAGTISWQYDGLEQMLGPSIIMALKQDFLGDWDKPLTEVRSGDTVYKGDIVGKLVDNYSWYLVVYSDVQVYRNEKLQIEIGKNTYKGVVAEVLNDNRFSVVIQFYNSDVAGYRVLRNVKVYKEPLRGIIIPQELLIEADEATYVKISYRNKERIQPVRVVGKWDKKAVVDGLPQGSFVVLSPVK